MSLRFLCFGSSDSSTSSVLQVFVCRFSPDFVALLPFQHPVH